MLVEELQKMNVFTIKGNPQGLKGYPDREIYAHELFKAELKLGKEHGSYYKRTKMQVKWDKQITQSGGKYVLLVGLTEVNAFLQMIRENLPKNYINHFE